MKQSWLKILLLASLCILHSACGWQLRGMDRDKPEESAQGEAAFKLVMKNRNHGLAAALNRVAWENEITFSEAASNVLVIENEKLEKRPLTVTETGVAAQYQLTLTITFSQLAADGEVNTPPQQIVNWRSYDFDAQLVVAKAQEEESLIVEMREELAQRMLSMLQ